MIARQLLRSQGLWKHSWRQRALFDRILTEQNRCLQTDPPKPSVQEQAKQQKAAAQSVSSWLMFPWERRQMDGESVPLSTWEKVYWWAFVGGLAILLFSWTQRTSTSTEAVKEIDEELEARKREVARAVLAGKSLISAEEDPFDGFTPRQIEKYVQEITGASTDDPYEGMTPEEINAYVSKHGTEAS